MLLFLAGYFVLFGFGLVSLGGLFDLFVMEVPLPIRLFVILMLAASTLGVFGYSNILLYGFFHLMLFDK